jgi:hypothetical protein
MTDLPDRVLALRRALPERFRWLESEEREPITAALHEGWGRVPLSDEPQAEGHERIARMVPLFAGPTRTTRLTGEAHPSTLVYDPETEQLRLALGTDLSPMLWPPAQATPDGIRRDLAAYLDRPHASAHRLSRRLRVYHGSLDELGLESIDQLAQIVDHISGWMDSAATWRNGSDDDPWPDETAHASMLTLRHAQDDAQHEVSSRWPSISMRTLWSRSVLTLQQAPYRGVVLELRWDPAPPDPGSPWSGSIPIDLPADLAPVFERGDNYLPGALDELLEQPLVPSTVYLACALEPSSPRTHALLRQLLRDPAARDDALGLCDQLGAWSLLLELQAETDDPALRAQLARWNAPEIPAAEEE